MLYRWIQSQIRLPVHLVPVAVISKNLDIDSASCSDCNKLHHLELHCASCKNSSQQTRNPGQHASERHTLTCAVVAATSMQKHQHAHGFTRLGLFVKVHIHQLPAIRCRGTQKCIHSHLLEESSKIWGLRLWCGRDLGRVVPESTLHTARPHHHGWRPSWWIHGGTVPCPSISSAWSSC